MMTLLSTAVALLVALIGAWLVPRIAMRIIMAARFKSGKQQATNYAGDTVSYGLALVWPVWAASLAMFLLAGWQLPGLVRGTVAADVMMPVLAQYSIENMFFILAVPLVVSCFFFGWLDDRFGARGDGGFTGHFKALRRGQLRTAMVKVLGIGLTALIVSVIIVGFDPFHGEFSRLGFWGVVAIILSTCAIALTANMINLFDLRPARASKVYAVIAIDLALIFLCIALTIAFITRIFNPWQVITQELIHVIWMLGPVFAVWRYDAGGRAMLGDAGANPAGALLGLFAVSGLYLLLPVYVVIVFIMNMISEKVSYSAVIEKNPTLKKIDMWGRPKT
ncbi:MAG: hypothetical protein FWC81_03155 [Coriobacteriia bacterium]|nr:hypothetical protein [Coriobacteriia bacterium]